MWHKLILQSSAPVIILETIQDLFYFIFPDEPFVCKCEEGEKKPREGKIRVQKPHQEM